MSDTDSFIDEVTEEVRRDRLYGYARRYGWIGAVVIVLIVAGAAWNEYTKAQARQAAEALGDSLFAALTAGEPEARAAQAARITTDTPEARAALDLIVAAEATAAGNASSAVARLEELAVNGDVPEIYRQLAGFKALLVQSGSLEPSARRLAFLDFAQPGHRLRVLAEEQLALIDIETGDRASALSRYQSLLIDAETGTALQQRALQAIVALGGDPATAGTATE